MPFTSSFRPSFKACSVRRASDEDDVQPGLALTPSQVAEMTRAGVPISGVNAMGFFDGHRTLGFDPGLLNRRGVDLIDVWNAQMDSREKLRDVAKKTKSASAENGGE